MKWNDWLAPGVILAAIGLAFTIVTLQVNAISGRFSTLEAAYGNIDRRVLGGDDKLDRRAEAIEKRIVETNQRVDRVLENQTSLAAQLSKVETELSYIRSRLDRVADKLQVSALPGSTTPQVKGAQDWSPTNQPKDKTIPNMDMKFRPGNEILPSR
jgi:hypothetical protein